MGDPAVGGYKYCRLAEKPLRVTAVSYCSSDTSIVLVCGRDLSLSGGANTGSGPRRSRIRSLLDLGVPPLRKERHPGPRRDRRHAVPDRVGVEGVLGAGAAQNRRGHAVARDGFLSRTDHGAVVYEFYVLQSVHESLGFPHVNASQYPDCGVIGLHDSCSRQRMSDQAPSSGY